MDKVFEGWAVGGIFIVLAVAVSFAMMPHRAEIQPVAFSHQKHYAYFRSGDHARHHLKVHENLIGEVPEELARGLCTECHGSFDEAADETPKIRACAGCHGLFLEIDLGARPVIRPCVGCHRGALTGPAATVPGISVCADCHRERPPPGPEEAKLGDYLRQAAEIPWVRVYDYLPGDIVFSHERHVVLGKVDCQRCHGEVQDCARPLTRLVTLRMEDCMACHKAAGANNDCLACHK